jgi:hypothetical protein
VQVRRRAIVPGFHKAWLNAMIKLFADCNDVLISKLDEYAESGKVSATVCLQIEVLAHRRRRSVIPLFEWGWTSRLGPSTRP